MHVLMHDNQLGERGTTNSMLDYARTLTARGHDVTISYWSGSPANVPAVIERVGAQYQMHPHDDRTAFDTDTGMYDTAYFIKSGANDGLLLPDAHNLVHAVFQEYDPHGSRYVYISKWLGDEMRRQVNASRNTPTDLYELGSAAQSSGCADALEFDYLNLIADMPEPHPGLRAEWGIPQDAFVILRYGGLDTFDITWAQQAIEKLISKHKNWYFVGINTAPFTTHPRARFLPMIVDPVEKASAIAAADVFLTARGRGESFGVAIAEALQVGVPILAWSGGVDQNHVVMLDGLGALYESARDLKRSLHRLARGQDPASPVARRVRGDEFRPETVAYKLERLLESSETTREAAEHL